MNIIYTNAYINPYAMLDTVKKTLRDFKVRVKVPRIALYTEEEIKLLGVPTSQINDNIDKNDLTRLDTVMLSVYELLDIADNGFGINILNPEMIPKIVELLDEALEGLKYSIEEVELKDKIKNFMKKVLDVNREYVEKKMLESVEDIGEGLFEDITKVAPRIDLSKIEV
jgi:hypothetical protein